MMDKIAKVSQNRPFAVIGSIALVTVVMLAGIPKITTEAEMRAYVPSHYPSVKTTLEIEKEFGLAKYQFVLIKSENVTKAKVVKSLLDLQQKLATEPRLENYIVAVESYLDLLLPHIVVNNQLLQENQLELEIQSQLARPEIGSQATGYITRDQKICLLHVRVNPGLESSEAKEKTLYFEDFVNNYASETGAPFDVSITGEYSISKDVRDFIDKESRTLLIAAVILIVVILALAFRRLSDVVLSFMITGLSIVWVMGIMGHFDISFFTVAIAISPLLFGISTCYALHMTYRNREEESKGRPANEAAVLSVKRTGAAVFLAAITTAIGLGSWLISDIPPIRDFGFLCMLGALFSFLFAVTLLPALWVVRGRGKKKRKKTGRMEYRTSRRAKSAFGRTQAKIMIGITRHPKRVAIAIGTITFIAMMFATQTSTAVGFGKLSPTGIKSIEVAKEIKEHFPDPSGACTVLVKGDITDPVTLGAMIQLSQGALFDAKHKGNITYSFSVADLVFLANDFSLPENSEDVQTILGNLRQQYSKINMLITSDNRAALIVFMGAAQTDSDLKLMVDVIRGHVEEVDPNTPAEFAVGGIPAIMADLLSGIPKNALKTSLITFTLIALVLCLIFRSLMGGLMLLVPIGLALVWGFGAFYVLGVPLNLITALISSLLIGIGIDFSVHLAYRYREEREKRPRELDESMRLAVSHVGKVMLVATATICGVFGVLMISRVPALGVFGGLMVLMLAFCLIATLFVLPPLLLSFSRKREK